MLINKKIIALSFSLLLSIFAFLSSSAFAQNKSVVLTSVGPMHSLTKALLAETSIDAINMPEQALALNDQGDWFSQASDVDAVLSQAKAVVSLNSLWPQDSLFSSVKAKNNDVVNIDATEGIKVVNSIQSGDASPYFWVSPSNIAQSAKTIASGLGNVFPDSAEQIAANEQALSSQIAEAKSAFEQTLSEHDLKVYGLTDEFIYLTEEFEIPVLDYFIKPDADWTIDDYGELIKNLYNLGTPMALQKEGRARDIGLAINTGGSSPLILDTYETSTDDIFTIATENLNKITSALVNPQGRRARGMGGGGMGGGGMGGGAGMGAIDPEI